MECIWNLLQNSYDITHLTLGMLLHYLGKFNIKFSAYVEENASRLHFLIASNFVIRLQMFIFSVFKRVNHSPYWL